MLPEVYMALEAWSKTYPNETVSWSLDGSYRYRSSATAPWTVYAGAHAQYTYVGRILQRSGVYQKPDVFVSYVYVPGQKRALAHRKRVQVRKYRHVAPLPATCKKTSRELSAGSVSFEKRTGTNKYVDSVVSSKYTFPWPNAPTLPSDSGAAYTEAYVACLAAYNDEQTKMLSTIAELHETMAGLASIAPRLESAFEMGCSHLIDDYKRFIMRYRTPRKALLAFMKHVSGYWLEWSFGIKPLLADAEAIATAMADIYSDSFSPIRVVGKGKVKTKSYAQGTYTATTYGGFGVNTKQCDTSRSRVKYKLGGTLRRADPGRPLDIAGINAQNVLPAVFEVVPWSWLVDYFTNMGYLIEIAGAGRMELLYPWKVKILQAEIERTLIPTGISGNPPLNSYSASQATGKVTVFDWSRDSWDMEMPGLILKAPSGPIQMLNMAAVAVQRVGGNTERQIRHLGYRSL